MRSYHRHREAAYKKGGWQWVLATLRQQSSGFQPLAVEALALRSLDQANLLAIELRRRYSKVASQAALQCRFRAPDESGALALWRIASPIQLSCVEVSYDPG